MISRNVQKKPELVRCEEGVTRKMMHMTAPQMWVNRTVSSVSDISRVDRRFDRMFCVQKKYSRVTVMTPSVVAESPIQTMATIWEGVPIEWVIEAHFSAVE